MRKRTIYFIVFLTVISFVFMTGCAKEEKPVKKEAVKKSATVTTNVVAARASSKPRAVKGSASLAPSIKPIAEERVLFSFEEDTEGWEIPLWAAEKQDHVAKSIEVSGDVASEGKKSMKINNNFPGGMWTASVVEMEQFLDMSPYRQIAVDIYIPPDTPLGLRAKIILTIGDNWKFTEMTRSIPLVPGEWVTIKASIEPGSYEWKRTVVDEAFRQDVRKIVIRIESNRRPVYEGPVYIDNVRIGK